MKLSHLIFAAAPAALLCLATPASAGPLDDILYPADAHGILPMERILDEARDAVAGIVMEIELEKEHGRLIYEVEIVTPDEREVEIEYDARTGEELSRKVKKYRPK